MSSPYLPVWATAQEASEWLQAETGQQWPLARLLEAAHKMSVWIDCHDDEPEHVIEGLFQGRREGFRAEVVFGSDIERLKFVRDGGTLHISRRPDGALIKFEPPIKFPVAELRFEADCLRRVAAMRIVERPVAVGGAVAAPEPKQWKMRVQAEAAAEWKRLRAMNCNPTRASIRPHLLRWCKENNVLTSVGINPSDGYLRTHVLSGRCWTPPQ